MSTTKKFQDTIQFNEHFYIFKADLLPRPKGQGLKKKSQKSSVMVI